VADKPLPNSLVTGVRSAIHSGVPTRPRSMPVRCPIRSGTVGQRGLSAKV